MFQMSKIFLPNQLQDHLWEICREIVQKTQGETYVTLFGSSQCRPLGTKKNEENQCVSVSTQTPHCKERKTEQDLFG